MRHYSFVNTSLHVNGVEIGGWRDGDDLITLARIEDSASHIVSGKGEMIVSLKATRAGTVTFNLDQTSNSNTYLSTLMAIQENAAFLPVAVMMKDVDGNDIGTGSLGYITKPADMVRGIKTTAATWVITVERLDLMYM